MSQRLVRSFLVPLFCLVAVPALADGFIVVRPPHPPVPPPWPPGPAPVVRRQFFPLEVTRHKVTIEVDEVVARTRVDETFSNPNDQQLEGDYMFPLPPGAAVSGFTMKIGGKEVAGEVLEKDKARQIYESIVRQMKDPGLLEYVERGLFRARVFPIPARGGVDVSIEYSETLPRERGTATYRYPLDTGKYIQGGYQDVVIDMKIRSSLPLRSVQCPAYESALVARPGEKEARVSLEAKRLPGDKDLVVTWNVSEDALAPVLMAHRGIEEDGFFYFTIAPRPEKPQVVPPKDVVFVIDTSGSMLGVKIEQVQKALRYCLSNLNAGDRFSIVDFATEARRFRDGLVEANEEAKKAAGAYVDQMKARGGTNIEEALRLGLADLSAGDRLGVLVLLTDGEPTIGVVTPEEILKTLKEKNPAKRRAFVFGVGDDLNAKLLDAIAKEARGATQYIRPKDSIEVPLANFFDKIDSPILTDLELTFQGGGVEDWFPRPLPDLFRGEQLDVFGRYKGDGMKTVVLKGKYQGELRAFEYSLPFEPKEANAFIPRLWAMRKIGYLLEQMRLAGETQEVKDEVVRLSKRYGVITPYTSYLILEEDRNLSRGPGGPAPAGTTGGFGLRRAASDALTLGGEGGGAPGAPAAEPAARAEAVELYDAAARGFSRERGADGVDASRAVGGLKAGSAGREVREFVEARINRDVRRVQEAEGRTFYLQGTRWIDGALLDAKRAEGEAVVRVKYLSDEYFDLLAREPGIGKLLSLGTEVTFAWKGKVYAIDV